ncbi:unnamed protein product, partial [Brenthis ino]
MSNFDNRDKTIRMRIAAQGPGKICKINGIKKMSLRNVKKVVDAKSTQGQYVGSDDDFEPLCTQKLSKSRYEGLLLSYSSGDEDKVKEAALTDTEKENNLISEEVEKLNLLEEGKDTEDPKPECTQLEKKKKKKKQKSNRKHVTGDYVDEIDKSVSEVNAMLGEPSEPSDYIDDWIQEAKASLFCVSRRHLNSSNELSRLFGPESDNEPRKRHGRRPNLKRFHNTKIIHKEFSFQKIGLSMSIERREKGVTYFTYDHDDDYQKLHREFLRVISLRNTDLMAPIEASLKAKHVEGLIEASDVLFRMEDNTAASNVIEEAIAYMQFVAHPSFNILDLNTRLEYKYFENRAFHILILKYIHLLTNRACHRTALELAKILMNLDPSDPLAVVFIIDTLALRAREHYWLVETIEYLDKDREVGYLFNMKFSKALASFHNATEAHGDMNPSCQMLQHAFISYPWALREILDAIKHTDDAIRAYTLFNEFAQKSTSNYLKNLIHLYAALTASQWREPPVLNWFIENAKLIAEQYDEHPLTREVVESWESMRQSLFRGWPEQIQRHLNIIKCMSNLLVDGEVPEALATRSYDPIPPRDTVNRYGYKLYPLARTSHGNTIFSQFFASIMPNYDVSEEEEEFRP